MHPEEHAGPGAGPRDLRLITISLAAACGLAVANLYYAQPLLPLISKAFHVSSGTATAVVTASQIGYALGLILLLPLGDLLENRALVSRLSLGTAGALLVSAVAPSYALFLAMLVLVGVTSVVAQILVPFAAYLAPPAERGRFVGQVMSGLLLGILLARTVASLVAAAWGWRSIYAISAGLMVVASVALRRFLPRRVPERRHGYWALLGSVVALAREEPALRRRSVGQGFMFAAFSAFWTAIAYELVYGHRFDQAEVGAFALVGAAGAAVAPIAGRLGDRGYEAQSRLVAASIGVVAMIVAALGSHSVVALAVAAVLLDLAVQGHQVISQREIYSLRDDARARINSVYMGTVFVGGAASSAVTGLLHDWAGWAGVAFFAAGLCAASLLLSGAEAVVGLRRRRSITLDETLPHEVSVGR
jgi:predicted MFS family arabinose efflux permease